MKFSLCRKCSAVKELFNNGKLFCRPCKQEYEKRYRSFHSESLSTKRKTFHLANKEEQNKISREYYYQNINRLRSNSRNYQNANKLMIKENKHPLYSFWHSMLSRCYHSSHPSYRKYKSHNTQVCDRWSGDNGFNNFVEDMYPLYQKGLSLDRYPDRDGNYEPGNCRWATITEQNNNSRANIDYRVSIDPNKTIYYKGEIVTLKSLALLTGIHLEAVKNRYALYGDIEKIVANKLINYKYPYNGHNYSMIELSFMTKVSYFTLRDRINKYGWSVKKAVETPV